MEIDEEFGLMNLELSLDSWPNLSEIAYKTKQNKCRVLVKISLIIFPSCGINVAIVTRYYNYYQSVSIAKI